MKRSRRIRVLVVDDSAVFRRLAADALGADPEIEVVGMAADPYRARDLIGERDPDVLTLDLEMPRMDGLTFLRLLMEQRPLPVVVVSSLTEQGSDYGLEALRLGAIDLVGKAGASAGAGASPALPGFGPDPDEWKYPAPDPRSLILLGASIGGTEALREVLTRLPADMPPIAIVQHLPAVVTRTFAARLNRLCRLEVREAVDGEPLRPGTALIAPGNLHLLLHWRRDRYIARLSEGPPVWHQRPSVDLLFASAAAAGAAPRGVAGLLTGMGKDGAEGLLQLRRRGAITFAQDEATSVVFGMPRAAWQAGATDQLLPLDEVASFLTQSRSETFTVPAFTTAAVP